VVLDLDGTVVPYAEEHVAPSPRVCAAVAAVLAAGVPVSIATGRAVWSALPTAADLGLHGIKLVCSNGAMVYDADSHQALHVVTIDPAPAAFAMAACRDDIGFAVELGTQGFRTTPNFDRNFAASFVDSASLEEITASRTPRLVARVGNEMGWGIDDDDPHGAPRYTQAAEHAAELAAAVLDPVAYGWEIGYTGWIDVMAPGVSKATGAAMLAQDLGVDPSDTLVVGDGTNDLQLFAWAGYAVAMGQSPVEVKEAADETTLPVTADGVAVVLERWFG
jgi:hydroxymethylpyrimidine pyrophosphatase-like HAD family hydrolase